jgi:hypothetical protein
MAIPQSPVYLSRALSFQPAGKTRRTGIRRRFAPSQSCPVHSISDAVRSGMKVSLQLIPRGPFTLKPRRLRTLHGQRTETLSYKLQVLARRVRHSLSRRTDRAAVSVDFHLAAAIRHLVLKADVRLWPKADIAICAAHVCSWGKEDITQSKCLLLTISDMRLLDSMMEANKSCDTLAGTGYRVPWPTQACYERPASSRNACTASNSIMRFFSMMMVCVPSGNCTRRLPGAFTSNGNNVCPI